MDYFAATSSFLKELFKFKNYNQLPMPKRVLAYIAMIPIMLILAIVSIFFVVNAFFYKALITPVEYLEKYVDKRADKNHVYHASQCVIYMVCMPTLFLLNTILAMFSIYFFILFFLMQVFGYLASFGATAFQPFILEYSVSLEKGKLQCERNEIYTYIFLGLNLVLDIVGLVLYFVGKGSGLLSLAVLVLIISSLFVFKTGKKEKKEKKAIEKKPEE